MAVVNGTSGNDSLAGTNSNDTIDGGAGADTMAGGGGNDAYYVDNANDVIVEVEGDIPSGTDTVYSSVTWTLYSDAGPEDMAVEHLTLTGTANINATGNEFYNVLIGNAGNNVLDGRGGSNFGYDGDTMKGGAGNDTYYFYDWDTIVELADQGTDTVFVVSTWSGRYQLPDHVENAVAGAGHILSPLDLIGNSLRNKLTAGDAGGILDGGTGADTLVGGSYDDIFYVDNSGDLVQESASGGYFDEVRSSVSYTLGTQVELLTLTGGAAVNGTGNANHNILRGNSADNILNGLGGYDEMYGGAGSDTYVVDSPWDYINEASRSGNDIIKSSVSFTLGSNVEQLTLTGSSSTSATGNTLDNTLVGNSGSNTLSGSSGADTLTGGSGADTLTGGSGYDTLVLTSSVTYDESKDFSSSIDTIRISQAGIRVGDGDTSVEGAKTVGGPGGFATSAELVVVTDDIAGNITASKAAVVIGSATSKYGVGRSALFLVDNGADSALYLFKAADADAAVEASELTRLLTLDNTASTVSSDILFGA